MFDELMIPVDSDGEAVRLHAWLANPDRPGKHPAISMAHGFAGLKDRGLRAFAERFAKAGFIVIVHDHRGFGVSGGEPRGDIDPWRQIADWRRVLSYLETIEAVDPERIGIWGSSYAGGHAMVLGATDPRVRAIVSQVPTISGFAQSLRRAKADDRRKIVWSFVEDDRAQLAGTAPVVQQVVSMDPQVPAVYRSQAMIDYHESSSCRPESIRARRSRCVRRSAPGCMSRACGSIGSGPSRC
jgi:uncharacterized protein